MAKSERLLELMDVFRQARRPLTGQELADKMGVSLRTLYRDIDALRALGMAVDGEAGVGYLLRGSVFLPPLTLSSEEIEALTLGLRGQLLGPDEALRGAARGVLSKIEAVLPDDRKSEMQALGLFALPRNQRTDPHLSTIRAALRDEEVLHLVYQDGSGAESRRDIWPVALGFLTDRQDLIAWCCLRQGYRRFVTDRMVELTPTGRRIARPRRYLLQDWIREKGLPDLT